MKTPFQALIDRGRVEKSFPVWTHPSILKTLGCPQNVICFVATPRLKCKRAKNNALFSNDACSAKKNVRATTTTHIYQIPASSYSQSPTSTIYINGGDDPYSFEYLGWNIHKNEPSISSYVFLGESRKNLGVTRKKYELCKIPKMIVKISLKNEWR